LLCSIQWQAGEWVALRSIFSGIVMNRVTVLVYATATTGGVGFGFGFQTITVMLAPHRQITLF
jgi:hypothetical protein